MLILMRKKGQKVIIEHGAMVVTIIDVMGKQVKLGFDAPKEVEIDREEIYEKKQAQRYEIESDLDSGQECFISDIRDCSFKNIVS